MTCHSRGWGRWGSSTPDGGEGRRPQISHTIKKISRRQAHAPLRRKVDVFPFHMLCHLLPFLPHLAFSVPLQARLPYISLLHPFPRPSIPSCISRANKKIKRPHQGEPSPYATSTSQLPLPAPAQSQANPQTKHATSPEEEEEGRPRPSARP